MAGGGMGGTPSSGGNVSSNTSPSQSSSGFTPTPGVMPMIPSQLPSPYQPSMGGFQGGFSPFGGGFQGGYGGMGGGFNPYGGGMGGGFNPYGRGFNQGFGGYGGMGGMGGMGGGFYQPFSQMGGRSQMFAQQPNQGFRMQQPMQGQNQFGGMGGMGGQAQQNQITDPQTGRSFIPGGPVPQDMDSSSAYTRAMRANEASLQPTQQPAPSQQQALTDAFNQRNVAPSPQDMGNAQNLSGAVRNDMQLMNAPAVLPDKYDIRQGFGQMGNQGIGGAMNYMSGPRASSIGSMLSLLGMR